MMQADEPPEQKQKTDEELAQERMSQWVKSDDATPAAAGEGVAAEPEVEGAESEQAEAEAGEPEEDIELDEEEAAEEVQSFSTIRLCPPCTEAMTLKPFPAAACSVPLSVVRGNQTLFSSPGHAGGPGARCSGCLAGTNADAEARPWWPCGDRHQLAHGPVHQEAR
jgi:hypothetical protein